MRAGRSISESLRRTPGHHLREGCYVQPEETIRALMPAGIRQVAADEDEDMLAVVWQ